MAPNISSSCKLDLKHRTILIGVVQSILSVIFLILTAACVEHPTDWFNPLSPAVPDIDILRTILITLSVTSAVVALVSIVLIFAAATNRPLLLLPWLILNPIGVVIYVVAYLYAIAVCAIHIRRDNNALFITGHLAVVISVSMIAGYKIVTVYTYYKHLKNLNF